MADEPQQPTTPSLEPAGAPAPEERVGAALERAAERSGVDLGAEPAPQPDRPATGVQTPEGATAAAPGTGLDGDRATTALREKLDAKRQARYLRVLEQVAERAVQESERAGAPATETPPAAPATNPYDFETDYRNWYEWEQKAFRDGISSSFDEKLKPVLAFFDRQQQAEAAQAEAQRRAQTDRSWWEERRSFAEEAHETYAATEEGKGYMDRMVFMVGAPGDPGDPARGIPPREPVDGALTIAWLHAGRSLESARRLAIGHVHGVTEIALREGENPAVLLDRFNKGLIAAVLEGYGGGRGSTVSAVTAAVAPPSAAKRRAQANRQVASSAVTGSVAEAGAGGGGDLKTSLAQLATEGRLGTTEMRELAGRFFPKRGPVEAMKSLRKVLAEMGAESAAAAAGN